VLPGLARRGLEGITFDLPGLGFADRPTVFDYSWSGLSRWVVDAIEAAGINDFHLVVHDLGGPIGFDVIRRIPARICSLTVLNTLLHVASFRRPWVMEPFAYLGIGELWLALMRTPLFIRLMRMIGVNQNPSNDEILAYRALLMGEDGGRAFLKIMRSFERTEAFETRIVTTLSNKTFPAQVIWGKDDPALRMEDYAPSICQVLGLPDWHRVDGKHFLQEDSPDEIARYVRVLVKNDG
jgi:pimeloyl-ACP methyl ester carboxylesterase